jgi:hypothetical protein
MTICARVESVERSAPGGSANTWERSGKIESLTGRGMRRWQSKIKSAFEPFRSYTYPDERFVTHVLANCNQVICPRAICRRLANRRWWRAPGLVCGEKHLRKINVAHAHTVSDSRHRLANIRKCCFHETPKAKDRLRTALCTMRPVTAAVRTPNSSSYPIVNRRHPLPQ